MGSSVVETTEEGSGKSHDLPEAHPIPVRPAIVSNLSLEHLNNAKHFQGNFEALGQIQ
jgi:hypothetical protein